MKNINNNVNIFYRLILTTLFIVFSFFAHAKSPKIYSVTLHDEIDKGAARLIKKAVERAELLQCNYLIIDLNTYGGLLDAADEIRSKLLSTKITTVVFINNNAASAGALISIACDSIYMKEGASIGAATVVDGSGNKAPDKYQSYMRSLMRSTAETNHRNPTIAEAMVDEDVIVSGIKDSGKILTFTAQEALKYNYCNAIMNNISEIVKKINTTPTQLIQHKETAIDKLIGFLLSPIINSLLIMMIIGGIYFEMKAPGIGLPTLIAIIGAVAYFAPLYLEGLAANWEILLFVVGLILLLLEIFVIPGFGIAGIAGIVCVLVGLTLSLINNDHFSLPGGVMEVIGRALFRVTITLTVTLILLFTFGGSIFNFPVLNKMVLKSEQQSGDGFTIKQAEQESLIQKTGIALTDLRPSGKVIIDDEVYDAIADAEFILKNEAIIVTKVVGYSLKVKRAKSS